MTRGPAAVVVSLVVSGVPLVGLPGVVGGLLAGCAPALLLRWWTARLPADPVIALVSAAIRVRPGADHRISWRGATVGTSQLAVASVLAAVGVFFAGYAAGATWLAAAGGYLHAAAVSLDALQEIIDRDPAAGP